MAMFVGASCVDTMPVYKGYDYCADVGDSFFDNMSDSVAFGEVDDTLFGHLILAGGTCTKNDTKTARIEDTAAETEPVAIEVELVEEQESKCDLDVLATDMNTLSWLPMKLRTKMIKSLSCQALVSDQQLR
ncbi:hypothetical protein MHU86_13881 [Fragilaria crotonensis]|nr:hypothetical protein MHU86_13881 [Fragilaria crotonensis]